MTSAQLDLFGPSDCEYDLDFIIENPILAICARRTPMCRHPEPIHAPALENVRCFYCGGQMKPVDIKAYRERIANLWQHECRAKDGRRKQSTKTGAKHD